MKIPNWLKRILGITVAAVGAPYVARKLGPEAGEVVNGVARDIQSGVGLKDIAIGAVAAAGAALLHQARPFERRTR